jgi:serine/threonine protein kinase/tetratricopeptide (TPR) repeat protein
MDRDRIGKYKIIGELGRGTMGEVYKAHDPVLNRFVALKTLPARLGPDDETLQRFQREAQAAALLNHPNIVTVHDFGEEQGLLYMAMELLEGIDLRAAIDRNLLKTLDEKLFVMDAVLLALEYAHAKGVVHRDVKPANIHLAAGRQVKLMDFGLARVSSSEMTQEGIVLGTPNYMSPEQALGDKVDGRSDLFSTGAVLYELLTGHKPFEAETTPSVLFQVVHKQPPPVRRWVPDIPTAIVAVVNRALEKDLERRFASAREMRAALAAAREAPAAKPAKPLPPPTPTPTPPRLAPPPLPPGAAPPIAPVALGAAAPPLAARVAPPLPAPAPSGNGAAIPSSRPASPRPRLRAHALAAGIAILVLATALLGLWLRGRSAPAPGATAAAAADALGQELLRKQLRLAQRELDAKNYKAAIVEAQGALKLSAGHPDARTLIATAQDRLDELERSAAEARRLLDAGDHAGASRELSHVLELDPHHPAAAELTARLNDAFKTQAEQAQASVQEARRAAAAASAPPEALRTADEATRRAQELMAKGAFAEATSVFLENRDELDSARRTAVASRRPTPSPREAAAAPAPAPALATPPPPRGFVFDATKVTTAAGGGPAGFDTAEVRSQRPPQFSGQMEFEVLPPTVRTGEPFVVRIHLRNDGKKSVKIKSVSLAAVVDGRRTPASVKPLQREVSAQSRALVAEYSGVWSGPREWTLEAVVTADRDETVASRLKAN